MTQKDYILIARHMAWSRPGYNHEDIDPDWDTKMGQWRIDIKNIGDALMQDNSNFKREKFNAECLKERQPI